MIAVIDYNMGNTGSILNMLKKLGHDATLTRDPQLLIEADALILPGVGAFDRGMSNLAELDLIRPLNNCVQDRRIPILGICLGMQLLTNGSDEGVKSGLGWIHGHAQKFNFSNDAIPRRIPHMGWNNLKPKAQVLATKESPVSSLLFQDTAPEQKYYFVHSYHVCCESENSVLATTEYGFPVTAAIGIDNIVGTQFHPEKSHRYGLKLMDNFARAALMRTSPQNIKAS